MDTNLISNISDPATQAALKSLPASWQHYIALATSCFVLLTALGRVAMVLSKGGGLIPMLRSVFFGSAHAPVPPTDTAVKSQ